MIPIHDSQSNGRQGEAEQGKDPVRIRIAEEILKQRLRADELALGPGDTGPWWWHGYVGAGKITLLTSQWKSGKTTLVSILLARMLKGGELAGLDVARSCAAIFTEENRSNWEARCRKLEIVAQHSFFPRPFHAKPTMDQWLGLVESMLMLRQREGLELVVIDPLGIFLPRNKENTASGIAECLLPMRELTAAGLSVLLVHHPRKGTNLAGQAARGSGALASIVDIVIEMNWYGKADRGDRRRCLNAYSRHEETRLNLVVELTAAGNDYLVHATPDEDAWKERWHALSLVLKDAGERLTQQQILEQWPEDFPRPDRATISRALKRVLEKQRIMQNGSGRKNDPFRYWLPGKEEDFFPGRHAPKEVLERYNQRQRAKFLARLRRGPEDVPCAAAARPADEGDVRAPAALAAEGATQTVSQSRPGEAQPPATEPPIAQSDASLAASLEAEAAHVAPQPEPISQPAPAPTPEPAPPKRSRRKPGGKAPAPRDAVQEPKAAAPTTLSVQPAAPAPQPAPAPASLPAAELISPPPPASLPVPGPVALSVDVRVIPTPDPVLSVEEQKRRSRRWPYG